MEGRGRQIGGLVLCLIGVLGVCLICGLPMWRETSFVGANIVTAQSVWDGLWLHCVFQSTGQMQCKRHTTSSPVPSDLQAGRALTLASIITGFLGFIITLLGGGVVNCSGQQPNTMEPPSTRSSKKKACLLGGALCILSGILCLVSVSWSAVITISVYNDPLVASPLRREVGSSIYIGWASCVLLLLGGTLICLVCGEKQRPPASFYSYMPYSSGQLSNRDTLRSEDVRSNSSMMSDQRPRRMVQHVTEVHAHESASLNKAHSDLFDQAQGRRPQHDQVSFQHNPSNRSDIAESLFMARKPNLERDVSSRASKVQSEYYYIMP
ncbi:claudin-4-like [Sphaeramia orbicularis]|uniref:Claudin-4-like n=1 Tax=Sphaeramia orbicularis TaxID=375764 RepID=A0A673BTA5_9TELE|nr:claudin-4-like [Sphaeramia orbicularis]